MTTQGCKLFHFRILRHLEAWTSSDVGFVRETAATLFGSDAPYMLFGG